MEQRNEGQWVRVRVSGLIWFCHKPARSHAVVLMRGGCTHTAAEEAWVACQCMSVKQFINTDGAQCCYKALEQGGTVYYIQILSGDLILCGILTYENMKACVLVE